MKLYFPYNLERLNNLLFCPLLFVFLLKSFFYSVVKDQRPTLSEPDRFAFSVRLLFAHFPSRDVRGLLAYFPDIGCPHCGLVGLDGLEPSTSRLSGARSSHLSYKPEFNS